MKLHGVDIDRRARFQNSDDQEPTVTVELTGGHDPEATVTVTSTGTKNMYKELQGMNAEKVAKAKATLAKAYERAMNDDGDCDIYDPSYRCLSMVLDAVVRAIDLLDKALERDR